MNVMTMTMMMMVVVVMMMLMMMLMLMLMLMTVMMMTIIRKKWCYSPVLLKTAIYFAVDGILACDHFN